VGEVQLPQRLRPLVHPDEFADRQHTTLGDVVRKELQHSGVDLMLCQGFQQHPDHLVVEVVVTEVNLATALTEHIVAMLLTE
jgi:hypothetical protein